MGKSGDPQTGWMRKGVLEQIGALLKLTNSNCIVLDVGIIMQPPHQHKVNLLPSCFSSTKII